MKNQPKITENTEFLEFVNDILPLNGILESVIKTTEIQNRINAVKAMFSSLINEEENTLKQDKLDSRPELDPEDRDRNRKREDRRQDQQASLLSQVVIVTNNNNGKNALILATDFDPKKHTLLLGTTKNEDKGPVSYEDIQNLTQDPSFMNTKTTEKLLAQLEQEQQNNPDMGADMGQADQATQVPPPRSKNGKDKLDPTSSYPDWDHSEEQLVASLPAVFNTSTGMVDPMMGQQPQTDSQTLQKAGLRIVSTVLKQNPELQQANFINAAEIPVNTTGMWFNAGIPSDIGSGQLIAQTQDGQAISIAVKIGPQRKLVETPVDAKLYFMSAISSLDPVYYKDILEGLLKDIVEEYRTQKSIRDKEASQKVVINPQFAVNNPIIKKEVITPDMELDQFERLKDNIKKKVQRVIVELINRSTSLKTNILYEALSGKSKYIDPVGKSKFLLSGSMDGTNAKLIPLELTFCRKVAKGRNTRLNIIFADIPELEFSVVDKLADDATQKAGTTLNEEKENQQIASSLEKIFKDLQNDPLVLLEAFESDIQNIVFVEPVYYSDYYSPVVTSYNTIEFNPGYANEEEATISVEDEDSNADNDAIESESQLMENYLLINDLLVDMVNNGQLSLEEAQRSIHEEFDVLNEKKARDYKKEYREYHGKPEQIKRRAGRVKARRKAMKQGRVRKGDGKDVHHKNHNPRDNGEDNLQVMSKHKNRSIKEEHGAGEIGTDELRKQFVKDTPFMVDPVKFVKRFKKK